MISAISSLLSALWKVIYFSLYFFICDWVVQLTQLFRDHLLWLALSKICFFSDLVKINQVGRVIKSWVRATQYCHLLSGFKVDRVRKSWVRATQYCHLLSGFKVDCVRGKQWHLDPSDWAESFLSQEAPLSQSLDEVKARWGLLGPLALSPGSRGSG